MNENINLCEILKDCPKGTKFFSYMHGEVEFYSIDQSLSYPIIVEAKTKTGYKRTKTFSIKGISDNGFNGICTLVPSLEQPDWSKWKCPKPKFDPKTLKPFDKVLVRGQVGLWSPALFTYLCDVPPRKELMMDNLVAKYVIPYNDDTKHLIGTTDEAPKYYRYWED